MTTIRMKSAAERERHAVATHPAPREPIGPNTRGKMLALAELGRMGQACLDLGGD